MKWTLSIVAVLFITMLFGCYPHKSSKSESCAITVICTELCTKYGGSSSFSYTTETNMFGNIVLSYSCICYPKSGFGEPVEIKIPKDKVDRVAQTVAFVGSCNAPVESK